MINQIRNSVFTKILWGLMGLCLLNISVDTVDPNPQHISEDLSINDQESLVEIFVEHVLGYENAFEEYDDHDPEDYSKNTNVNIDKIAPYLIDIKLKQSFQGLTSKLFPDYKTYLLKGFNKLDTPPPKI